MFDLSKSAAELAAELAHEHERQLRKHGQCWGDVPSAVIGTVKVQCARPAISEFGLCSQCYADLIIPGQRPCLGETPPHARLTTESTERDGHEGHRMRPSAEAEGRSASRVTETSSQRDADPTAPKPPALPAGGTV